MATWTYLDAYLSSIPAAQRQNLLNLLYSDILSQKIQTLAGYEASLNAELAKVSQNLPTPLFKLRTAPFQSITNSANFNEMEGQGIEALKIVYAEAVLLENALDDYNHVVAGRLDSVEATISRLEKQVDSLEILAANANGYVTSVYDSFNEQNTYRLNRVDTVSTTPFIIPDVGFISSTYDAQIIHNSVQLPLGNQLDFRITSAVLQNQVPASSGVVSSLDIPTEENAFSLASLLDSDDTTYWAQTVDIPTLSTNKVETDLVLQLAGTQQINNIYINPFTRFPYVITSIQYTKNRASGVYFEMLDDPLLYPMPIGRATNIQFSEKYADSVKIHIIQQNYSSLRYIAQGVNNTITQIFDIATGQGIPTADINNPDSYYFAMTSIMQDLLNVEKTKLTDTNTVDVYEFLYGIKNLIFSKMQYNNKGIYVTKPYTIPLAGGIGLNVVESIPNRALASVEYDVLVEYQDIDASGIPTFASSFAHNILPEEIEDIEGEVLDGTNNSLLSNWTATTRFGVTDTSTIQVYQNNILLGQQFYTVTQDNTSKKVTITIDDNSISPAQRNISFYTINYTPTESAYVVDLERHDQAIINLRMFLRSQSPNKMVTPSVDSFSMKFKKYV